MKSLISLFSFLFLIIRVFGQDCYINATKENISSDFNKIWMDETYQGTIGDNNQRIEIRFIEIAKDAKAPATYHVKGKSRVNSYICGFHGTLKIDSIGVIDELNMDCVGMDFSAGRVCGTYEFDEDTNLNQSGRMQGTFTTMFNKTSSGDIIIQNVYGFKGLCEFIGEWTEYNSETPQYCSWAIRIPPTKSENLFRQYENESYLFNIEYLDYGWKPYVIANLNTFILLPIDFNTDKQRNEKDFISAFTKEVIENYKVIEAKEWWK